MPDEEEARQIVSEDDDKQRFYRVLFEALDALEEAGVDYLGAGSIALTGYGDPEPSTDADLFLKRDDADRAREVLDERGFETEKSEPDWLYKAYKDDVLVDLIFELGDDIEMDDEMARRGPRPEIEGRPVAVLPPEDFIVSQAISAKSDAPTYWFNGLRALVKCDIDWEYLLRRAELGPLRVLSLLIFARADGIEVPDEPLERLLERLRRRAPAGAS